MDVPGSRLDPVNKILWSSGFGTGLDEGTSIKDKAKGQHLIQDQWALIPNVNVIIKCIQLTTAR